MKNIKIKNIVRTTGGNTNVVMQGVWDNKYHEMFKGKVDDIDMEHIPYGEQEVLHISVVSGEDILILQFGYPYMTVKEKENISSLASLYNYSIDLIEKLYVKYDDIEFIKDILITFDKNNVYKEVNTK